MATARHAANACIPRDNASVGLQAAIDAFLSQPDLRPQTRRSHRLTLAALTAALDAAGAKPTTTAIEAAVRLSWGTVAPATWNRHAATVRSFLAYAARHGMLPRDPRRARPAARAARPSDAARWAGRCSPPGAPALRSRT
jgi:site-specific recombinase XerD